jgi:hypothetical protein
LPNAVGDAKVGAHVDPGFSYYKHSDGIVGNVLFLRDIAFEYLSSLFRKKHNSGIPPPKPKGFWIRSMEIHL